MEAIFVVFDPKSAPRERSAFVTWWRQTEWTDLESATSELQAWYREISVSFPSINTVEDEHIDEEQVTDYSFAPHLIAASFNMSIGEDALAEVTKLADKHGLGFFDATIHVQSVSFPDGSRLIKKPWWKLW